MQCMYFAGNATQTLCAVKSMVGKCSGTMLDYVQRIEHKLLVADIAILVIIFK